MKEIQERQIAINQCKEYLTEEFIKSWIRQITENNIEKRKKEFLILFRKLFDSEKIKNRIEKNLQNKLTKITLKKNSKK